MRRLLLAALLLPGWAAAQDVQNFVPALGADNYFSQDGAGTVGAGNLVPSVYVNYALSPLVLRDEDDHITDRLVEHLTTLDAMVAFGLHDRVELGVHVPVHLTNGDDDTTIGAGDMRLVPKARLYGDGGRSMRGFALALSVPVALPTGDQNAFLGEHGFSVSPKLAGELGFAGVRLAANAGALLRSEDAELVDLRVGHELTYGAGIAVELGRADLLGLGEAYGAVPVDPDATGHDAPVEAVVGLRWFSPEGPVLSGGIGGGLRPDYGSPAFRIFVGLAWAAEEAAELDEPEPVEQPPEPPRDRDGDGLLDADDTCPDSPEDADDFEDADGCPDPDNDQDTVLDTADRCPLEPEDPDGFEDADGCPDPDNDQDTILDGDDRCPDKPETVNQFEDTDGCPDVARVRVTEGRIEILDKVYFETSKAVIQEVSYPVLDQVVSVMKRYPDIRRVRVEGHTDSRGKAGYNRRLSQQRAEAVRAYLGARGVELARLEAQGYGEERPITENRTAAGRGKNRRVEFVILERK